MKTKTQLFVKTKDCVHSAVFSPALANPGVEKPLAQAIYISRAVLPPGTTQVKITMSIPEGGADAAFNSLTVG
jgi:hypothetical protein